MFVIASQHRWRASWDALCRLKGCRGCCAGQPRNVKAKAFDKFSQQDAASKDNGRIWFEGKAFVHCWDLGIAAAPALAPFLE